MNFELLRLAGELTEEQAMQAANGTQQLIFTVGSLVLFGLVMYFAIIRPQKKREKNLKEQMSAMRVGDKVVTIGGIVGRVANIKDDEITISTSLANTLITFQKSAISTVETNESSSKQVSQVDKAKEKAKKKAAFKVKGEDEE